MDSSKRNDSCNGLIYFNTDCDQQLENVLKKMITFCFTRSLNVGTFFPLHICPLSKLRIPDSIHNVLVCFVITGNLILSYPLFSSAEIIFYIFVLLMLWSAFLHTLVWKRNLIVTIQTISIIFSLIIYFLCWFIFVCDIKGAVDAVIP